MYYQNIKLTIEISPFEFFETKANCIDAIYNTMVLRKIMKLPIPWSSKVPKRYKQDTKIGDLHRAEKISKNFDAEVNYIIDKYRNADCWLRFINNFLHGSIKSIKNLEDSYTISPNLCKE